MPTEQKFTNEIMKAATYVIQNVSLPDLVSSLAENTKVKWLRSDFSAVCNCPMHWHKDRNASFHMNKMDNGNWIFHCFGCSSKGNVVQFYMDYCGEDDFKTAVISICKTLNIVITDEMANQIITTVTKKVDIKRELENSNIIVSNQCRLLLRKNFNKHKSWVMKAYKALNKALDEEDKELIEKIGYEASKRITEKTGE